MFRNASLGEVSALLGWAAAEGWNPGKDDVGSFYASDPKGFFVAEEKGVPIASISVINHSDRFAFLGLYICRPEHRGRGVGLRLWQHAITHAGERTIGLDGVPDQQENYRRSGFASAGETYRFEGALQSNESDAVRPAHPEDVATLIDMETVANGYAKEKFLGNWLRQSETRGTYVLDRSGLIEAFATVRICGRGAKIGPLVATSMSTASELLGTIASEFEARPLVIDVPNDQKALDAYCRENGMQVSFNTNRMYRGPAPRPGASIRAVATLELG